MALLFRFGNASAENRSCHRAVESPGTWNRQPFEGSLAAVIARTQTAGYTDRHCMAEIVEVDAVRVDELPRVGESGADHYRMVAAETHRVGRRCTG